jgi:3-oxoacyl-[acyl-carrier protein] reductase
VVTTTLDGKVALVTGATRGIGFAIAKAMAAAGAQVAMADLDTEVEAGRALGAVRDAGPGAMYVHADVSDEIDVRRMVDTVMDQFGRIDILVNNAGIASEFRLVDLTVDEWDRMMAVNLRSVFLCCRAVLPHMTERGSGRIINTASQLAYLGGVGMTHYCASKGGVISLTRALAREVAPDGILVNGIAPGPVESRLLDRMSPEWKKGKLAELPLRRFGEPEDIAPTAVFLASDDSSYYCGQILGPNGGDVMT